MENSANALIWDVKNDVLIDLYGTGVLDVCTHSYKLNEGVGKLSSAALRNFKMIASGYSTTVGDIIRSGALDTLKNLADPEHGRSHILTEKFNEFLDKRKHNAINIWKAARTILSNKRIQHHLGEKTYDQINMNLEIAAQMHGLPVHFDFEHF